MFAVYRDPDGVKDANSVLLTSYTDTSLTNLQVGLYDGQPLPGLGFGTPTSFSNFSVSGTLTNAPEPGTLSLFVAGLLGLGFAVRKTARPRRH